jgi:hypothetical protein
MVTPASVAQGCFPVSLNKPLSADLRMQAADRTEDSPVNSFRIRLAARSALKLDRVRRFRNPDHHIVVDNAVKQGAAAPDLMHSGLIFDVEIDATDIHTAIISAFAAVNPKVDMLSVSHRVAIADPFFLLGVDVTEGVDRRTFAQLIDNSPELHKALRPFTDTVFRPLFERLERLSNEEASAKKSERSMPPIMLRDRQVLDRLDDQVLHVRTACSSGTF